MARKIKHEKLTSQDTERWADQALFGILKPLAVLPCEPARPVPSLTRKQIAIRQFIQMLERA
jgi:hypothetical protein